MMDSTGHVDVEVKALILGPLEDGTPAEVAAHRLKDRLNTASKRNPMIVYIVREVGGEGEANDL